MHYVFCAFAEPLCNPKQMTCVFNFNSILSISTKIISRYRKLKFTPCIFKRIFCHPIIKKLIFNLKFTCNKSRLHKQLSLRHVLLCKNLLYCESVISHSFSLFLIRQTELHLPLEIEGHIPITVPMACRNRYGAPQFARKLDLAITSRAYPPILSGTATTAPK